MSYIYIYIYVLLVGSVMCNGSRPVHPVLYTGSRHIRLVIPTPTCMDVLSYTYDIRAVTTAKVKVLSEYKSA